MHDYTKAEIDLAHRCFMGEINQTQYNFLLHTTDVRKEKVEELVQGLNNSSRISCLVVIVLAAVGFFLANFFFKLIGL